MKKILLLITTVIFIFISCEKSQRCWLCTTTYNNLSFNKQYNDYTSEQIKLIENSELIIDTIIKTKTDTLYWVINVYDSIPSILNPAIDTFFLVSWTKYDRIEWDNHPEIHQYWKYDKRQGFGVLETIQDTIINKYIKTTRCREWNIN